MIGLHHIGGKIETVGYKKLEKYFVTNLQKHHSHELE